MKVRSMVGLIPLFAVEVLDEGIFNAMPEFKSRLEWFLLNRPDLATLISKWVEKGKKERHLLSLLRGHRMKRLLKRMPGRGGVFIRLWVAHCPNSTRILINCLPTEMSSA